MRFLFKRGGIFFRDFRWGLVVVVGLGLAGGCGKGAPDREMARGVAALARGELLVARGIFEGVAGAGGGWEGGGEACNWLGLVNLSLGLTNEAVRAFERALEWKPELFEATYNLGCVTLDGGDWAGGLRLLRRAADLDRGDIRALLKIGDWTTRNGRWDLAKRMYFEAQKRSEKSADALVGLGRLEQLAGRGAKAETFYMKALEAHPGHGGALYNLGVLYMQQPGRGEEGRAYLERYLALHGEGERAGAAKRRLGGEEVGQGSFRSSGPPAQPGPAGREWARVQEALQGGRVEEGYGHAVRALDLAAGGDPRQQRELTRRALEAFPDRPAILLAGAQFHAGQGGEGGLREARDLLLRAQGLAPEDPMILFELARVSSRLAEYDVTVLTLKQLIRQEPGNADALWELAETYGEKLGMTGRGIAAYADFTRRFPTDPRAGETAARIRGLEAERVGGGG